MPFLNFPRLFSDLGEDRVGYKRLKSGALSERGTVALGLKVMKELTRWSRSQGKSVPGRRNNQCRGLEVKESLACLQEEQRKCLERPV